MNKPINPRNYKVIVSDFDGTLIGPEFVISDTVKNAIKHAQQEGFLFTLASGRFFHGLIENACRELGITTPVIVRGGAQIYDPKTKNFLWSVFLPNTDASEVIDLLKNHDIPFWVEKDDTVYTIDGIGTKNLGPTPCKKLEDLVIEDIPKIGIRTIHDPEKEMFIDKTISTSYPTLHMIKSYSPVGRSWDITAKDGTKHIAVLELSKLMHVAPEEIIGIGDGYNDYPLLSACGYKVAMGTAPDELKEIADYIAPSYEEDGAAVFLKELLIQNQ